MERICLTEPSIVMYSVKPPFLLERTLAAEKYVTPGWDSASDVEDLVHLARETGGNGRGGPIGGSPTHMTWAPASVASCITSATRAV